MSFGRKGVAPGAMAPAGFAPARAVAAPAAPSASRETPEEAEMRRRREAFIAQDRARRNNGELDAASSSDSGDNGEYLERARDGNAPARTRGTQSMFTAYILWFFFGGFSLHRFYLGAFGSGALQVGTMFLGLALLFGSLSTAMLGTGILCLGGLWVLADAFLIPGLHREATRG